MILNVNCNLTANFCLFFFSNHVFELILLDHNAFYFQELDSLNTSHNLVHDQVHSFIDNESLDVVNLLTFLGEDIPKQKKFCSQNCRFAKYYSCNKF